MTKETTIFLALFFLGVILFAITVRALQELFDRLIRHLADKITSIFKKKD